MNEQDELIGKHGCLADVREIAAFDEPISSTRALDWGLVTKVVEDGQALDEARTLAGQTHLSAAPEAFRQGLTWLVAGLED